MDDEERSKHTFVCGACEQSLDVNDSMKEALIERGCVICGTPVSTSAFT